MVRSMTTSTASAGDQPPTRPARQLGYQPSWWPAFLTEPSILVLDEATSSVDTRTKMLIQQGTATLGDGRTSFLIAHRLSTIRDADVILVMEHGRIVQQGSHDELLAAGGAYTRLYAAQFSQPPTISWVSTRSDALPAAAPNP
jgi:ABC-type multidrug transport system ATPase subunit